MLNRQLLTLLCLAMLISAYVGVSPSSFQPAKSTAQHILTETLSYQANDGFRGTQYKLSILAGTYTPWRDDKHGTYYLGPHSCFLMEPLKTGWVIAESDLGKVTACDCGLFIPYGTSAQAKLFVLVGTGKVMPKGTDIAIKNPEIVATTLFAATGENVPLGADGTIRLDRGAGAVAGVAVAAALADAEKGNIWIYPDQPEAGVLNKALGLATTPQAQH